MNFGIVGLGYIANKFAKTLNEMNETLYACASRDINKALEFKNKYNAIKCYDNYQNLFKDSNVDIVYIATPNRYHFENAVDALNCGKNVIVEKPFTTNPKDAKKLYDLAKEKNLFIMEALWPEFFPSSLKLKEIINNKVIGNVKSIKVTYGSYKDDIALKKYGNNSLGGGALLDIGIYPLSFVEMIAGSNIKSIKSEHEIGKYKTDIYSKINLIYENEISADILITFKEELKKEAIIEGDKGSIYIPNHHQNEGFIVKVNEKETNYSYPFEINGFEYQIREAIKSINEKKNESAIYNSESSIKLMKLLYDIRSSWNMKFEFEK
ncbi:MAG: Gfo/Idh/MocA family oxidoreductase [Acholeplasmatales bacterium]|nr:Gfo/Idh/MocA family oxidoreductase [Acholeplasmatales bacterium]